MNFPIELGAANLFDDKGLDSHIAAGSLAAGG